MQKIVVDSSVSAKWIFEDEENTIQARSILQAAVNEEIALVLPTLWIYEMANGLRSAVIKHRYSAEIVKRQTMRLKSLYLPLIDCSPFVENIIDLAVRFSISAYDATYITLAKEENCPFVTGDKKLYIQVNKKLGRIIWVGDYTSKKN